MLQISTTLQKLDSKIKQQKRQRQKNEEEVIFKLNRDFLRGAVVKKPPANAGDMGLSPGPGRSHMPWSN